MVLSMGDKSVHIEIKFEHQSLCRMRLPGQTGWVGELAGPQREKTLHESEPLINMERASVEKTSVS